MDQKSIDNFLAHKNVENPNFKCILTTWLQQKTTQGITLEEKQVLLLVFMIKI
jgi:hypothetical protein